MRYLALDIGSVRVGIAVSDRDGRIATPLSVLPANDVFNVAPSFRRILEDWEPEHLVVGLPKTLAGEMGPQAGKVKTAASALAQKLDLPITFTDERFSSKEAKLSMAATGMKEKDMRGKVDKVAAALFLQTFLDSQKKIGASIQTTNPSAGRARHTKGRGVTTSRIDSCKRGAHRLAAGDGKNAVRRSGRKNGTSGASSTCAASKISPLKALSDKVPAPVRYGIYGIVAFLFVLLVGSFTFWHQRVFKDGEVVTVQIAQGSGGAAIAHELVDNGLIDDVRQYFNAVNDLNASKLIQSGTYEFVVGTPIEDIVKQLMLGPNTKSNRLTIPEGSTVSQTADAVQKALGISASDFMAAAKASSFVNDYFFLQDAAHTAQDSLEGYLWPSTYDFTGQKVTAADVIKRMLDEFKKQSESIDWSAGRERIQQQYDLNFSDYDFIKMASLIQKEATTEDDRPLVSSVFYNRLRAGMDLQSDATMAYSLGHEPSASELKEANDYNTYLNQGLPPTPICSPSKEFIQAALNPAQTDYYFFLIIDKPNYTTHTFSKTYEQHLEAIDKANAAQT